MSYAIHALVSIFAVMNPVGNVPLFLALTEGDSAEEQRKTARKAVFAAFGILALFLVLGHVIFSLFGITIAAFRVAGGILVFGIAYNLLQAKPSHLHSLNPNEHQESLERDDVSITPLATPLIAGPGTIATTMALAAGPHLAVDGITVLAAVVVVLAATYLVFRSAPWINRHLSQTGLNIITRMMGLLLAIIAVQMAVSGLDRLFPGWRR